MEHTRNGDLKGSSYDHELLGRHRNGAFPIHLDLTREAAIDAARPPLPPKSTPSQRRTYADGELDVFSAERYFKGAMDGDAHNSKEAVVETVARPAVPVSKPAWTCASAASAGSAATSAHSRTVLLRDAHRRPGGYHKCCLQVSELLRPCTGKRAVRIDAGAPEAAAGKPAIEWYRDLRMEKAAAGTGLPPNSNLGAAAGREDIIKAAEHPGASFRSFTLQAPVKAGSGDDDGGGSESSSELFEIKSLMIDDCCPYEPSEASIQWSVVTASAVDVYSERGRRGGAVEVRPQNRPVGLLTGCVSRRAVDVSRFPAPPPRRRVAPP